MTPNRPPSMPVFKSAWQYTHSTGLEFQILAERDDAPAVLAEWQELEPALRTVNALADLPVAIVHQSQSDDQDALLAALIRLAQTHHTTASVTLLWSMAPWLRSTARRLFQSGTTDGLPCVTDLTTELEARMFERIMTFPIHRRFRKIRKNLVLDTLQAITRHHLDARVPGELKFCTAKESVDFAAGLDGISAAARHEGDRPLPVGSVPDRDTECREVLVWGVRNEVISTEDAELLYDVYLKNPQGGLGQTLAAAKRGRSDSWVYQRCSRAAHRLRTAIADRHAAAHAS